jgi:Ca2+-binding RTX toxin-like protein
MRKRISRTMAVIVVSALMVVLTAGVAFAATVNCPQGGSFDGVCQGTNDADHLYGSNNDDEIYALGGDDHVYAFDGNDQLIGGDGNDVAIGYLGDDRIWGQATTWRWARRATTP